MAVRPRDELACEPKATLIASGPSLRKCCRERLVSTNTVGAIEVGQVVTQMRRGLRDLDCRRGECYPLRIRSK